MTNKGRFTKGNKLGKGRPPVLLPEVQHAIDANKNAFKVLLIQKLQPKISEWFDRVIEQGIGEGDCVRLKMLAELAMGKMVDDPQEFPLDADEKLLVLEYRRRKQAANGRTS